jgi:hypothetical protein
VKAARWGAVPVQPADPILGLVAAFKLDTHPSKVRGLHWPTAKTDG